MSPIVANVLRPLDMAALVVFVVTLILVAKHDLASLRIPDRILLPGAAGVVLLLGAASLRIGCSMHLAQAVMYSVLSCAFYLGLHFLTRGGIGFGDVKLAALIGLTTGWVCPRAPMVAVGLAFALAAIAVLLHIATRVATRKTPIPLAPYMASGAVFALIFAARIG